MLVYVNQPMYLTIYCFCYLCSCWIPSDCQYLQRIFRCLSFCLRHSGHTSSSS